ncbi:MAG: hypothetical protein IJT44_06080 [Clostridia bacterium]|nr:hypothetical protein [Clostridia bacterium]
MLTIVSIISFSLLGVALAVSAAVSDKASRDNMRDMTSRTAKRRMR